MKIRVFALSAFGFIFALIHPAQAATVWSGYAITFSKPDGVDPLSPQGQDPITETVALTRVNNGGGFINPRVETDYDKPTSPVGTLWAYPYNNPSQVVSAANWANLNFLPWAAAFGGNASGGPPGTIGQPAVVHLVADDVYLDVRLTGWTVRTGGGFSYQRAAPPSPADFNVDGFVDAADLEIWQTGFGADSGALPSQGNADADGDVDGADFLIWQRALSIGANAAPNFATQQSIPEPSSFVLISAVALARSRRKLTGRRSVAIPLPAMGCSVKYEPQ